MRLPVLYLVALIVGCSSGSLTEAQFGGPYNQGEAAIIGGQSNCEGVTIDVDGSFSPPSYFANPDSRVRLMRRILAGTDAISDATLQDLKYTTLATTHHGTELALGAKLLAGRPAGTLVAILKVCATGSYVTDWIESGGTYNAALQTAVADFKAALLGSYPTVPFRWHWIWDQGEREARDGTEAAALAWSANFQTLHGQMETYTSATLRPHILANWLDLAGATWNATVNSQKAAAATATDGYVLAIEAALDAGGAMQSDNIHRSGAGHNAVGEIEYTSVVADIAANP